MACPYATAGGRIQAARICPRTGQICSRAPGFAAGGRIACTTGGNAAEAAQAAATAREGLTGCATPQQLACTQQTGAQLYGAPSGAAPVYTTCSDPCTGTQQYRLEARNRFWPTFARPRWLTCAELYCGNR